MTPSVVDWRSGHSAFWDLDFLVEDMPLTQQLDGLKEDLAQIKYPHLIILDIGWYPEFSIDGAFSVSVVKESEWEQPLFRERCTSVDALLKCLLRAVEVADSTSHLEPIRHVIDAAIDLAERNHDL